MSRCGARVSPTVVHAHQSERNWYVHLYLLLGRSVENVAIPSRSTPVSLFLFAPALLIGIAVVDVAGVPTATVGFVFFPSTCLHCVPSLSLRVDACPLLTWWPPAAYGHCSRFLYKATAVSVPSVSRSAVAAPVASDAVGHVGTGASVRAL